MRRFERAISHAGGRAIVAAGLAALAVVNSANADNAPPPDPFARHADPSGVVLAVTTDFGAQDGAVRLSVYRDEETFLQNAAVKASAEIGPDGIAVLPLGALEDGAYAFVAYYDENRDGVLNRNFIGKPKEPFGFSNGVRPKLKKPEFKDAKVPVAKGEVVVVTIED
ncbi:MAG: DUF2141 domain-containing protein [Parvularculaceae bacterium]